MMFNKLFYKELIELAIKKDYDFLIQPMLGEESAVSLLQRFKSFIRKDSKIHLLLQQNRVQNFQPNVWKLPWKKIPKLKF